MKTVRISRAKWAASNKDQDRACVRSVSYQIWIEHDGNYSDEKLEKLVGRDCDGAGTDLMSGTRDMSWSFKTLPAAIRAFQKLKKKQKLTKLALEKECNE
jgi:hypothetical protein